MEIDVEIKIQKWGNSLAVRIPKSYAKDINIEQGSIIDIIREKDNIIISPKHKKKNLKELLDKISKENIHQEIDSGEPSGNEIL